jgi:copper chaperone CopZ
MRVPATAAVAAALLAAAVTGCAPTTTSSSSSKNFSGEQAKVADKIAALQSDGSAGKAAPVCDDLVTAGLKGKLAAPGSSCAQEVKKAMQDADGFDLKVTGVKVSGTEATATVQTKGRGSQKITRTFGLTKAADGWRISNFG